MREHDDAALELRLRTVLTERLGSLKFDLTTDDLEIRRWARDRAHARRRRWVVLGLAAALMLPAGWLAAGAPLPRPTLPSVALESPTATDPILSSPVPTTSSPPFAIANGPYQAIALRRYGPDGKGSVVDVVAIRADGQERVITRLESAAIPGAFSLDGTGSVSKDGWLAVHDLRSDRMAIVDLHVLGPEGARSAGTFGKIAVVDGGPERADVAWGPDGRLAMRAPRDADGRSSKVTIVDPTSGATTVLSVADPRSDAPLQWAADGSALMLGTGEPIRMTGRYNFGWSRLPVAGGRVETGFVPIFDDGRRRDQSIAGDRAVFCTPNLHGMRCPADGRYSVGRQDGALAMDVWDITPARGTATDAVFAATDRGMWVLGDDPAAVLTRLDDHGLARRTVAAQVGPDMSRGRLDAIAPDDSVARIMMEHSDPDIVEWLLLPTDGTPGTYHVGEFAGFVQSEVADRLGSGAFSPVGVSVAPAVEHAPQLPSSRDLDTFADRRYGVTDTDPVLFRDSGPSSSPGQVTIELGPIKQQRGHRIAIQFACAGPGSITLDLADQGYGAECMADDQSWGSIDPMAGPADDRVVPLQLTVDRGAAWRIAVYDLGP